MCTRIIAPSMLSANFLQLEKDVEFVNENADLFHLDIMDGTFVPNISFGFPVVEAIAKKATKPLDVHLMIINPDKYFERFAKLGAQMISFHLESVQDKFNPAIEDIAKVNNMLMQIRNLGCKAGLVINPDVPVEHLFPHLEYCDYVLIMSVFAGYGGQKFIPESLYRIRDLKKEILRRNLNIKIEVDGGVSKENINALSEAGAEIFVAGSAIFGSNCPKDYILQLRG